MAFRSSIQLHIGKLEKKFHLELIPFQLHCRSVLSPDLLNLIQPGGCEYLTGRLCQISLNNILTNLKWQAMKFNEDIQIKLNSRFYVIKVVPTESVP